MPEVPTRGSPESINVSSGLMPMRSHYGFSKKKKKLKKIYNDCIDSTLLECRKKKIKRESTYPHQQRTEIIQEKD